MVIPGFLLGVELRCFNLPDWMWQWQDYWCDYPAYPNPFANSFPVSECHAHPNSFTFAYSNADSSRRDQPLYFRYHRVRIELWI